MPLENSEIDIDLCGELSSMKFSYLVFLPFLSNMDTKECIHDLWAIYDSVRHFSDRCPFAELMSKCEGDKFLLPLLKNICDTSDQPTLTGSICNLMTASLFYSYFKESNVLTQLLVHDVSRTLNMCAASFAMHFAESFPSISESLGLYHHSLARSGTSGRALASYCIISYFSQHPLACPVFSIAKMIELERIRRIQEKEEDEEVGEDVIEIHDMTAQKRSETFKELLFSHFFAHHCPYPEDYSDMYECLMHSLPILMFIRLELDDFRVESLKRGMEESEIDQKTDYMEELEEIHDQDSEKSEKRFVFLGKRRKYDDLVSKDTSKPMETAEHGAGIGGI
ncbi:hypothetical protein ADUPG1_006527 [Aduncisulcus paluster]|uniref:Uncharacterized protein n=1 Tax=Aduncisulcus paluster TaxID=2918883 RepID=A0ABQ5KLJ5_9EUKA|nr:hypothetical protein ADUPG1_006527 [Aduncisulcus paluster]